MTFEELQTQLAQAIALIDAYAYVLEEEQIDRLLAAVWAAKLSWESDE